MPDQFRCRINSHWSAGAGQAAAPGGLAEGGLASGMRDLVDRVDLVNFNLELTSADNPHAHHYHHHHQSSPTDHLTRAPVFDN